jgi:IclR family acetate operon transcriptional repressor
MSLSQLTPLIRLTKASTFRLLYTLEQTGHVRKDEEGRYSIAHDMRLSVHEKLVRDLREAAVPRMRELVREYRETTGLAVLFENHIEVVEVIESPQTVHMGNTIGRILQPHASSLGKCITAFQPEKVREHLLRSYGVSAMTANTITDEGALDREFAHIRELGYATDRGETCLDGYCFGAPIKAADGRVFAAVSVSMPVSRLGPDQRQRSLAGGIRDAAAAISKALRF